MSVPAIRLLEMDANIFLENLNAEFIRVRADLRAEAVTEVSTGWMLLITSESSFPAQTLNQALRDPEIRNDLAAWSDGDLMVVVRGTATGAEAPIVLIRDGQVLLVSGAMDLGPEIDGASAGFAAWFEVLIGAPPPITLEVQELEKDLWGTPGTKGKEMVGFPRMILIPGQDNYTLVAFGGYGMNSYALYLTRRSGKAGMFLRLPWGGAYVDPDRRRPKLLAALREANELFELAAAKQVPFRLNNNMGAWYFVPLDGETSLDRAPMLRSLKRVREYLQEV